MQCNCDLCWSCSSVSQGILTGSLYALAVCRLPEQVLHHQGCFYHPTWSSYRAPIEHLCLGSCFWIESWTFSDSSAIGFFSHGPSGHWDLWNLPFVILPSEQQSLRLHRRQGRQEGLWRRQRHRRLLQWSHLEGGRKNKHVNSKLVGNVRFRHVKQSIV